jgi:hypothetical protein
MGEALKGPLHLQGFLVECPEELARTLLQSVTHPLNALFALRCSCKPDGLLRLLDEAAAKADPRLKEAMAAKHRLLARHYQARQSAQGPAPLPRPRANVPLPPSKVFTVETNEEEGVVRSFCRRCRKMFVLFDRALYWGTPRAETQVPESWPYKCVCGGHSFEVALGFEYPEAAMDENDIHTLSLAVRCPACGETAMLLDEEAT